MMGCCSLFVFSESKLKHWAGPRKLGKFLAVDNRNPSVQTDDGENG